MNFMGFLSSGGFCKLCGETAESYAIYTHIYEEDKYYYHSACLKAVLSNPEKHGSKKVDMAIAIQQMLDSKAEEERKRHERARALAERVK